MRLIRRALSLPAQLRALLSPEGARAAAERVLAAADDAVGLEDTREPAPAPSPPLAIVDRPATWRERDRPSAPFGALLHTTGRGVHRKAEEWACTSEEAAMRIWDRGGEGPHYVVALDGTCYRYTPEAWIGRHAMIRPEHRQAMLDGSWEREVPAAGVARWRARWPGYRSPQHLYPARSPNGCYLGVELVPLDVPRVPAASGGFWYTPAQMATTALLLAEMAARHDWPVGWHRTPRLAGHEDVEPYRRWSGGQGWDPGALRSGQLWFDWVGLLARLDR